MASDPNDLVLESNEDNIENNCSCESIHFHMNGGTNKAMVKIFVCFVFCFLFSKDIFNELVSEAMWKEEFRKMDIEKTTHFLKTSAAGPLCALLLLAP